MLRLEERESTLYKKLKNFRLKSEFNKSALLVPMKRKSTYYTACTARYMMISENVKGANQMITSLADTVTLNNGTKIPGMGLGYSKYQMKRQQKWSKKGLSMVIV